MTALLDAKTMHFLSNTSAASLSTQLVRRGFNNVAIRNVSPVHRVLPPMIGPAYTVRYIPAREDMDGYGSGGDPSNLQRQAIEKIPSGNVLVFDCRGNSDIAGIGAILCRRLQHRGVAGVVLDGGVRDTTSIADFDFPVYCQRPSVPPNYVGHHAADLQVPISCGGVPIYPGDILFGDGETVVVIPANKVTEIAEDAFEMEEREKYLLGQIEAGRSIVGVYPPSDETMQEYREWKARSSNGAAVERNPSSD